MSRKVGFGTRMDMPDNFSRYKAVKGHRDVLRIVTDGFHFYDLHRLRSAGAYHYANCPGVKTCPLCKAGDDPVERAVVVVYHLTRTPTKGKNKGNAEQVGQVLPWGFAATIQNELVDLADEEGPLNKYNIKINCKTQRDEQFQDVTINKTAKPKLEKEDKVKIKKQKSSVLEAFLKPASKERLAKLAGMLTGGFDDSEDEDESLDIEDTDIDEDEDEDDEEFDELLQSIDDEDDDDED